MKKQFCKHGHDTFVCGRTSWRACRICNNKRPKKPQNKEYAKRRRKSIREAVRKILDKLKDIPCMDCYKRYPPYVMDFDHRLGEIKLFEVNKFANVSSLTDDKLELLYKEIAKCDLVCSNCHRERTHQRR